jgi:hypothetical protein
MSFGPFIIFRDKEVAASARTNIHELIHFFQQIELLFVGHWILYVIFYIVERSKGMKHDLAYRNNPFEREAYANENLTYLITRKPYAWLKYMT